MPTRRGLGVAFKRPLITLVIPEGAGPTDNRIVITLNPADIPAELQTAYGGLLIGAIIGYNGATGTYCYIGWDTLPRLVMGSWDGAVIEQDFDLNSTGLNLQDIGAANPITVQVLGTTGTIFGLGGSVDFQIQGFSQSRGLKKRIDSAANSAAIGAEAIVLTSPSVSFVDGRCYEVRYKGGVTASVANISTFRVRKTNLVGQLLAATAWPSLAGALTFLAGEDSIYVKNVSGANISAALVLTLQASAGTSTHLGSATLVRLLDIRDAGAAADFANAIAIV
jgi:hypothetical protein